MGASKVLIIQTAFLGDLTLSIPLLKNIRLQMDQVEISVICRQGLGSFLKDLGLVQSFYEIKKKDKASYKKVIEALRPLQFDLLLSPHESWTSARLASQIKARKKIAYKKWWNFFFFDERIKKDSSLPDSLRQLSLLQNHIPDLNQKLRAFQKLDREFQSQNPLGRLSPVPEWASSRVDVQRFVPEVLVQWNLPARFVCLFPGSVWATKQWTEQGFIEVGSQLATEGHQVLVMGGPGEEKLAEKISSLIPRAISLAGKTKLIETISLLSRADLVVTNDSAGQHLAALVEAPTISIFGPTVQSFGYRPWNSRAVIVERSGLACRPCGKHGHQRCPIGTHECMKSISGTEVLRARQSL